MKFSKFISYTFHPINFSIIGAFLYFILVPKHIFKPQEYNILTLIFIGTYVFSLILIFFMKYFGMISSYHMSTVEERKFPTLMFISITFIIGHWLYKSTVVDLLSLFYFGYTLCLIVTYALLHLNRKISLHTVAIGGLIGFLFYFSFYYKINLTWLIAGLFLLSGLIATARLKMKTHNLSEIVIGFCLGIIAQLIVFTIYSI